MTGTVLAGKAQDLLTQAEAAHWVSQGHGSKVIYVIFDPNCPYCHMLYNESQAHHVHYQFRWIPVGILAKSSPGKAAAILTSRHPSQALRSNEQGFMAGRGKMGGAIKPLAQIPAKTQRELQDNLALLEDTGIEVVPKMLFVGPHHKIRVITGALDAHDLTQVLQGAESIAPGPGSTRIRHASPRQASVAPAPDD